MTALTDRIAHDHEPMLVGGAYQCSCGEEAPLHYFDKYRDLSEWHRAHTNAVTEAAVREHIAAALDDLARARHDDLKETKRRTRAETFAGASAMAYELAARIARGVTP